MTRIVWFRQDLRIRDNPALRYASGLGDVLPVYILDDTPPPDGRPIGGAARWWLHHSLASLARHLGGLVLLRGPAAEVLPALALQVKADGLYWNRCYEPHAVRRDTKLKQDLTGLGYDVASFNGSLLNEPWDLTTQAGGPFKVFTPYWRAGQSRPVSPPLDAPPVRLARLEGLGVPLDALELLPRRPDWANGWDRHWIPGESGAIDRLDRFAAEGLDGYATGRNFPSQSNVSRLSASLHWGEISPRQVHARITLAAARGEAPHRDCEKFMSELGWREFAHHLLYHFPELAHRNWRVAFDAYPWRTSAGDLAAWQQGRTGYPLVDAGMRELWATGYMHNRVRMIAASFLIKHLRIDWRAGEAWFWDTLVDADVANNAAGWQWVAGSGADAAPYFRIFNPVEQGRKFDPDGAYVRRWCPELSRLPDALIHAPFDAPAAALAATGVALGNTYPHPIVDHRTARAAALAGYEAVRNAGRGEN